MPRTIVLTLAPLSRERDYSEYWSVTEDGCIVDGLCWDEMLGAVARVTLNGYDGAPMLTLDEHKERAKRRAPRPRTVEALDRLIAGLSRDVIDKEALQEAQDALAKERDDEIPF